MFNIQKNVKPNISSKYLSSIKKEKSSKTSKSSLNYDILKKLIVKKTPDE